MMFSLNSVTADDTTIVECPSPASGVPGNVYFPRTGQRDVSSLITWRTNGVACPQRLWTIDWNDLEHKSLPETADADSWHAVWQNVVSNTGPLWPDYVLMLDNNMNYLARIGQTTHDPGVLFNFAILQASAALNPVRALAESVDAIAPSPGFPLVFRRVYHQPILSRYKLGPLGRGWSHNWDVWVQSLTNYNGIVIHGPEGMDRFFGRFADGRYTGNPGDNGSIIVTNQLYRLVEANKTTWQFNGNGKLDFFEDPNGNRITCGYSESQVTSLTHSSGRQLLLEYDGDGHLIRLIEPLGLGAGGDRVTTFNYGAFDFTAIP
jgi:YD repeat-containing protein